MLKLKYLLLIPIFIMIFICFNCKKSDTSNGPDDLPTNERFTEHIITDNFYGAIHVHAMDMDKDGDMDVLGASFTGKYSCLV